LVSAGFFIFLITRVIVCDSAPLYLRTANKRPDRERTGFRPAFRTGKEQKKRAGIKEEESPVFSGDQSGDTAAARGPASRAAWRLNRRRVFYDRSSVHSAIASAMAQAPFCPANHFHSRAFRSHTTRRMNWEFENSHRGIDAVGSAGLPAFAEGDATVIYGLIDLRRSTELFYRRSTHTVRLETPQSDHSTGNKK
jgi:hypothetical protein